MRCPYRCPTCARDVRRFGTTRELLARRTDLPLPRDVLTIRLCPCGLAYLEKRWYRVRQASLAETSHALRDPARMPIDLVPLR